MAIYNEKPLQSVLIKPTGPDCNAECTYCFYLPKKNLFPASPRMSLATAKTLIQQVMKAAAGPVTFNWQGGEPTLMGLDFFRQVVKLQKQYGRKKKFGNSLQTNGLLVDREWARFLANNEFLVGLSLDGPKHVHDLYRRQKKGGGTWINVTKTTKLLLEQGVAVNALSVINNHSVNFPEEIYQFHKSIGLNHMQFIPCVEKAPRNPAKLLPFSVAPRAYGKFLIKIFDLWQQDFIHATPTTFIRFFDSVFFNYVGLKAPDCQLQDQCGVYVVVEHNGDVYSCDFYVEPSWRLGNISETNIIDMLNSPEQHQFGKLKLKLAKGCEDCPWIGYCHGGCPKDWFSTHDSRQNNYLCPAYKIFFQHADPHFKRLARDWKQRHSAR
jgi:uncharacterized protein